MKPTNCIALATAAMAFAVGGCAHTPAGTSVEVALARKADLIQLPAPSVAGPGVMGGDPAHPGVAAVEPTLPIDDPRVERVGEAYSRGTFCLRAGRDTEAIAAFEEAVELDPTFTDAWENLAVLYEKIGDEKKAIAAFKKAKKIARQ